jgi:hypothetical protein
MNKKNHIIIVAGFVVFVAGGMFYAGMKYGETKVFAGRLAQRGLGGMNVGPASGQRRINVGHSTGANNGDFATGDIISKDDKSITIKTKDGGSRIVYYSDTTTIGKATNGTVSDLSAGETVMVNGKANADGSIVSQNIQIRPVLQQGQGGVQTQNQ